MIMWVVGWILLRLAAPEPAGNCGATVSPAGICWLTVTGFTTMVLGLTVQGFIQGAMLEHGADFVDSVKEMQPWWVARTIVGTIMDVALGLDGVQSSIRPCREGRDSLEEESASPCEPQPTAVQRRQATIGLKILPRSASWPASYFLSAAVFFLASCHGFKPRPHRPSVADAVTGLPIKVKDYSPLEQRGRQVYIRDGCWQCHSQYIRPVTGETLRWGPVSQIGESAYDRPHMFSTRRIGPDLTRVGKKVWRRLACRASLESAGRGRGFHHAALYMAF